MPEEYADYHDSVPEEYADYHKEDGEGIEVVEVIVSSKSKTKFFVYT